MVRFRSEAASIYMSPEAFSGCRVATRSENSVGSGGKLKHVDAPAFAKASTRHARSASRFRLFNLAKRRGQLQPRVTLSGMELAS